MKTIGFLAIVFGTAFYLVACSSMAVSPEDAYGNQLPEDFNYAEFAELNPDIALTQTLDSIKTLNAAWRQGKIDGGETLSNINAAKISDDAKFLASEIADSIAINHLQWSDSLVTVMRKEAASGSRKGYLSQFNIVEKDDELEFIKNYPIDSAAFVKTYLLYGKKDGRAYRACKAGEMQTPKTPSLATNGNYSAYDFCADTASGKPYPVYAIP